MIKYIPIILLLFSNAERLKVKMIKLQYSTSIITNILVNNVTTENQ